MLLVAQLLQGLCLHGRRLGAGAAGLVLLAASGPVPPRPESLEGLDPMVAGRIEEAWAAVAESDDDAGRWLELGRVYHAHELTEPAGSCYLRATELASDNAKAWYSLALARADAGDLSGAIEAVDEARRLGPGYSPAHWRRGRWLLELGRGAEAESAFREALRVDDSDPAAQVGLARALLERGEPLQAIPILEQVLSRHPSNGVAGQLLGTALRSIGDETAARRTLALATGMGAHFPDPWHEEILDAAAGIGNRLRLASARLARGETERVAAELEALARDHPEDVGLLNKLSEVYLQRGTPEPARAVLLEALAAAPSEFATLIHLAQAEQLLGDLEAALGWTERAIAANPRFWQAHFTRAGILHRAGNYPECLDALTEAMRLGAHQSPNFWLMRGDAQLQLADWAGAAASFEPATRRFPFLSQAFVGLAFARTEEGELEAAREALAAAAELQPEDATMAAIRARLNELESTAGADR